MAAADHAVDETAGGLASGPASGRAIPLVGGRPLVPSGVARCTAGQTIVYVPTRKEAEAIATWLAGHATSPLTGLPLANKTLQPNHAVRALAEAFVGKA